ncbi:MAG TPA: Hsp20/alpha crystallin family protein [Ktedonobacterales bacterium]
MRTSPRDSAEQLPHLCEGLNGMLDANSFGVGMPPASQRMPIDVLETARHYVVEAALPGVRPADLEVAAAGCTITIRAVVRHDDDILRDEVGIGEDEEEQEDDGGSVYMCRERSIGDLTRTVVLPGEVDPGTVEATYEHGLLTLWVPKAAPAPPRRIAVYPKEQ